MDDSEGEAGNERSSNSSSTDGQHKTPQIDPNKVNALISSDRAHGVKCSENTTQNEKVNDNVDDNVKNDKLKRRSSFDDDMDDQNMIDKTNANSNVSKIVANITRQKQFTNTYANGNKFR